MDTRQLLEALSRFASTMAHSFESTDVLYDLGDRTVSVLGAAGAVMAVATEVPDRLEFVTATDERVAILERVQADAGDGPCVRAFNTGDVVAVDDISAARQWPVYRDTALELGLHSVLGVPIVINDTRLGSLNVYDSEPRSWTTDDRDAARVLADIGAAYLVRAGELAQSRQLAAQLQGALDSRVLIEQAKGMVAREHHISVDKAFDRLRDHSRATRMPLREVAEAVVRHGLQL